MYIDGFEGKSDIVGQFSAPENALEEAVILYAKYRYEDYSGSAYILYMIEDKMYEVHGSHCSCNGLEGQWSPEEVTYAELEFRWFQTNNIPYACDVNNEADLNALRRIVLGEIFEQKVLN